MSSAPHDPPAPEPTPEPAATPAGPAPAARWQWPRAVYYGLIVAGLAALGGVAWLAQRQPPHPDLLRQVGPWDMAKPDWWLYPREANAFKRRVIQGDLHAITTLPGSAHLWVAGQGGLILHSDDGGAHWEQQYPATAAAPPGKAASALSLLDALLPAAHADAIKDSPQVQVAPRKSDPGDDPKAIASQAQRLQAANVPAPRDGAASTAYDTPAAAPAASTPRANRAPPVPAQRAADADDITALRAVHVVDEVRGWAVGSTRDGQGVLLRTRDGQPRWERVSLSSTPAALEAVLFDPSGQRGWIAGDRGTLMATESHGSIWERVGPTDGAVHWRQLLRSPQEGAVWAVGDDGVAPLVWLLAADGPQPVRLTGLPEGARVRGAVHPVTGRLWLAASTGALLELAPATGGAPGVARTLAPGEVSINMEAGLAEMAAVAFKPDGSQVWVVGTFGQLWQRDITGPAGWRLEPATASARLSSLGGSTWAVGAAGALWQHDGSTWRPQSAGEAGQLRRIRMDADGLQGSATSLDGWVLQTRDGGLTWTPSGRDTEAAGRLRGEASSFARLNPLPLIGADAGFSTRALSTLADGRSWGITTRNEIAFKAAGSATWQVQHATPGPELLTLRMLPDGQRGWAAGEGGRMLATLDGGKTWAAQPTGTAQTLFDLAVHADGLRLWAVGDGATVLRSEDGGRSWTGAASYRRGWAPWAFVLLPLLSLGLAGLVLKATPRGVVMGGDPARAEGASTRLASDQPVIDKAQDLLGYRAAVEALSSFIRNEATEPRVTLAVSGEWGSGKSSIMRMLQTELQRAGFRTAWYNAWHQQQEGRPLTALFNAIRQQAVPRWFEQPLAALRVRSRLIWSRGGVYRGASVLAALGLAVLLGDLLREDAQGASERLAANFRHHVFGQQTLVLDRASLAALNPFEAAKPVANSSDIDLGAVATACAAPAAAKPLPSPPLSPAAFCAVATQLLPTAAWATTSASIGCRVRPPPDTAPELACQFGGSDALRQLLSERLHLSAAETALVVKSAQVVPPPQLFSWLHGSLASGMAGLVLLVFTKGVSVYGLQLLAPLKTALGNKLADEGNKESAGTVERYRAEFCLLCQALDGRLVVFVDDLDRCTPETVNRTLELTNYLVDVGRCFVVIGAALERVKKCVRPPVFMAKPDSPEGQKEALDYANDYLRKLVHVELPVPGRGDQLHRLLEPASQAQSQAHSRSHARRLLLERLGLALATLAFLYALWMATRVGARLHDHGSVAAPLLEPPPAAASAVPGGGDAAAPRNAAPLLRLPAAASAPARTAPVGLDDPVEDERWPRSAWLALAASAGVLAAALGWKRLRRYRTALAVALGGALRERDSKRFLDALRLWSRLVIQHDPTPRQVKRFYNRARLLAAFEAGVDHAVDEAQLVALAALDQALPGLLRRLCGLPGLDDAQLRQHLLGERPLDDPTLAAGLDGLHGLWAEHLALLGRTPSAQELRRFVERVAGLEVR